MNEVLLKRRRLFHQRCLKYLKYVLNDHFVLVLLFLAGFLLYQYSQLLEHFPSNPWGLLAVIGTILLGSSPIGFIATYLETPDQVFLLSKESDLVVWIRKAAKRSFLLWGSLQIFLLTLVAPLFLRAGLPLWSLVLIGLGLIAIKYIWVKKKEQELILDGRLNWKVAVLTEQRRQQGILKFFALFTRVKGISSAVKRRAYLDKLTALVAKNAKNTWQNLYLRAFMRSGDYVGLSLRLLILSMLSLIFVSLDWLAVGLAFLFTYLLAFQLLALYQHYDYQFLTQLFPIGKGLKKANLISFLRRLIYSLTVMQMACAGSLKSAALLLSLSILLVEGYLRFKVNNLID